MTFKEEKQKLFEGANARMNFGIIFVTVILFVFCYFGSNSFFLSKFNFADIEYWGVIYHNFMAFILFFGIGLLFNYLNDKKNNGTGEKEYINVNQTLTFSNYKLGLTLAAIGTLAAPLIGLTSVLNPEMKAAYPLIDFSIYSNWWQILLYYGSYLAYYIGWEYLFRGTLIFTVIKKCGPLAAILISTMISALIHTSVGGFGKPMVETLSAIIAGLVFGWIAWRTKSIWWTVWIHLLIGVFTDIFIYLL